MSGSYVFDLEGDGLRPTKIYCIVAYDVVSGKTKTMTTYDDMREWLKEAKCLIGHNIVMFDIPVIERLLGVKVECKLIDTLAFSWYLYPRRASHGLEGWGVELGVKKPEIEDWYNLTIEEYCHRCEEDVKINTLLWDKMKKYLLKIYGDEKAMRSFVDYLEFKMDCVREQARSKWRFDVENAKASVAELEELRDQRFSDLAAVMPWVEKKEKKSPPKVMYKKDGSLSSHGLKWQALCRFHNLPDDYMDEIEVVTHTEPPNPASNQQKKDWLFSLGWVPTIFKYKRNKDTGELKEIPQLRDDKSGEMCENIVELMEEHPALRSLVGLTTLTHRIPLLQGMIDAVDEDGCVTASVQGLTNTLRFKHREVVNLPKPEKQYAAAIRGSLVARKDDEELCGADMSSLEDRLKHHFLFYHDPDYVRSMSRNDYDPHIALAVLGNGLTETEGAYFVKWSAVLEKGTEEDKASVTDEIKKELKRIKPIRAIFKNGNYACQYGAGASRIALTAGISLAQAKVVYEAYWKMNWAIRAVAKEQIVREVDGQKWLFNPISRFWYSLREEKDRFSTLIQGSASFVFDLWVMNVRNRRPQLTGQFHDEIILSVKKGYRDEVTSLLRDAIDKTNNQLKLNRQLDIGIQFGNRYSEIH